ncbi:phage gp29-like protein [Inhella inkyongensis]|uniref:Phage gp29-like protein n=1 Tax=Inhella inkyongensis TaxID=392593 RepID=A0A840S794_9BURK|nr:DUF935 family protein [Inhella inkyongensis]MBB5204441.1 phage gp29-like protein [Inhella inkyongensis]
MNNVPGLYVSPTEFVRFAEGERTARRQLADQIATRQRSPDFSALGLYLPNPDPILKKQGKDVQVYTDLLSDALVGGSVRRRKAGVVKMEWRVERGRASSRSAKLCEQLLGELDLRRLMRETLQAPLLGWQPLEVTWSGGQGAMVPVAVEAKPAQWFHFDAEAQLRFKSREAPFDGELLPARKFLVPAQDASYANPYGFADLSMCFWPTVFKRGGLKFWVTFTEKFGTPWLVGKVPRSTAKKEQDALLDQLESMVQDAVAVIPDDASVDVVESSGRTASAELYERLLMFCRSEISIALLGQNQTTESNSNRASATAGLQVTEDLRDADARLVEATVNQLLRWVVDLNEGEAAAAPTFELFEQEEVDKQQAERDEILVRAGAKLTREYFRRTYDLEEGDLAEETEPEPTEPLAAAPTNLPPTAAEVQFAEALAPAPETDALDALVHEAMGDWEPLMAPLVQPLQAALDEAAARGETAAELLARLPELLQTLDVRALETALTQATVTARVGALAGLQADGSSDGIEPQPADPPGPAFSELAPPTQPQKLEVHVHLSTPAAEPPVVQVTNTLPEQAPPVVHVHNALPEQAAPVVQVTNAVQPAEVTVVPMHPSRAVQTVQRREDGELAGTVTDYEFKQQVEDPNAL